MSSMEKATQMDRFMGRLDALPVDAFPHLTRMLTGYDLARLSHVNHQLFTELLARDDVVWRERMPAQTEPPPASSSWKQVYFSGRSRRFPGSAIVQDEKERQAIRGGLLDVMDMVMDAWDLEPFSIDVWFAMTPPASHDPKSYAGGILLGAQCEDSQDEWWPDERRAFIYVDPAGNLYCSITNDEHLVAKSLAFNQWHHLTLTVAHSHAQDVTLCAYLNGEKVFESSNGKLYDEWFELHYIQLGTGCIGGDTPGKPTEDFKGWYGFNGVIDECRFWNGVLTAEQARRLAVEDVDDLEDDTIECVWSMRSSPSDLFGSVKSVQCTRPRERFCELLAKPA